ncbi:phage tail protein [Gimesia fumaroli]|uniref:Uncharacterized protein n=1 Tax=Gimesia fumaroli TaxID=2527976 RepID=A0A518I8W0_9PLAN|nr:phage tail protein [Gimesia fumaroli]QDV49527.1 hypothetical protein Enr17x_15460 [Gimesia fumaroli]
MARTLTSATTTEKNKVTGAFPRKILEIQFGGATGNKYYAEELLHGPVPCEGRIVNWGQLSLSAEPGKVGGFDQLTITLEDSDRTMRSLFESFPGVQNKLAYVYLWFEGTDWDTDKIVLFAGVLSTPLNWNDRDVNWSISMKGLQEYFDKSIGRLIKQEDFNDVNCSECDGKTIPIVYGNPCKRVPACVIDRPGEGYLSSPFGQHDTIMTIHDEANKLFFTTGSSIQLVVGYPNNFELVTGSFSGPTSMIFNVTSRGSILASGNVSGIYAEGGQRYIMINQSALSDPNFNLRGYPLWLNNGAGWYETTITLWSFQGSQVAIVQEPPDFTADTSTQFKIGSVAQFKYNWMPGTPVYELGTYKYLLNYLPSKEVVLVEAKGSSGSAGGGQTKDVFLSYSDSSYSVSLNDKTHNEALGRASDADGVTTLTLNSTPAVYGFPNETIYATIKGIMNDSDDVIEDPADVLQHMLTNPYLGNISSGFIDSDSFTAAAASIVTKMAFAIQEEKKLNELVSNLAQQANCLLFWDQGKATLKYIETNFTGHQLALTPSNVKMDSIKVEMVPDKDMPTEMIAKFRQAIPSPEQRLSRTSDEAVANFKEKREELDLWAFQLPTSVAYATENWLAYKLLINRMINVSTFLNGLHLQPGDVVLLNYADGNGGLVFDGVYGRIRTVRHISGSLQQGAMEEIQLLIESNLWDFTINTSSPDDQTCARSIGVAVDGGRGIVSWPEAGVSPTTTGEPTTTGAPTTTTASGTTPEGGTTTTGAPWPCPDNLIGPSVDLDLTNYATGDCVSAITQSVMAKVHTIPRTGTNQYHVQYFEGGSPWSGDYGWRGEIFVTLYCNPGQNDSTNMNVYIRYRGEEEGHPNGVSQNVTFLLQGIVPTADSYDIPYNNGSACFTFPDHVTVTPNSE